MKKLLYLINSSRCAAVDEEDYIRCREYKWGINKPHRNSSWIQVRANISGNLVNLSNFIMNDFKNMYDHADRNPFNNQKNNLRPCDKSQNGANSKKCTGTTSIYKGVSWDTRTSSWTARIRYHKERIFLGYHKSEVEAAKAYDKAASKYHKEFAVLNFLEDNPMDFNGVWVLRDGHYAIVKDRVGTIYHRDGQRIFKTTWKYDGTNIVNSDFDLMEKLTENSKNYPKWAFISQES
jgi:hypothetical protein